MELCTLASGSSGNCAAVMSRGGAILIDAGISMRRTGACLKKLNLTFDNIKAILITHDHSDHINGLPMIAKYHRLPVFVPEGVKAGLVFKAPWLDDLIAEFTPGDSFDIGDFSVSTFPTNHDCAGSCGYRISSGGKSLVFATDMGCVTKSVLEGAMGADFAVLESNHDVPMLTSGYYPYPLKRRILSEKGHLSNPDCARLVLYLAKCGTKRFLLAHLSRDNNTPELALSQCAETLKNGGFAVGQDVYVNVARRDEMTDRYII